MKSGNFLGSRLEALKESHCVTWGELAGIIGISRAMLDYVRKGERDPGPKVMRKILAAETTAGLKTDKVIPSVGPPEAGGVQALDRQKGGGSKRWTKSGDLDSGVGKTEGKGVQGLDPEIAEEIDRLAEGLAELSKQFATLRRRINKGG